MYDINTVCKLLGVTSRTLRFWEQKKLITSTRVQFSSVRHYTNEEFEQIKRIIVLRSLGLSIKSIEMLINEKTDLKKVILEKRAEIIASIVTRKKELDLLNEALMKIDVGEAIFSESETLNAENDLSDTADVFVDAFLSGNVRGCYDLFSDVMKEYLPLSALKSITEDTLSPLGVFVTKKDTVISPTEKASVYINLEYEKLILIIKCVIRQNKIYGLWFSYAEKGKR